NVNDVGEGFVGSGVLSSDQPVVATLVQISADPAVQNRPLSNGFESGSPQVLLATVLKNKFNSTSKFSVQNASSGPVDLDITFYNADNTAAAPITIEHNGLPAGAAKYFDMGALSAISASVFNGSAVVSAVEAGTTNPAPIVASVLELGTNNTNASAFEGVTGGSTTVYMPSAICEAFGGQNTAYAVQNTSQSASATVTVNYSNGATANAVIPAGAKQSFVACTATGMTSNFSGSATISSTGADIVVIGKVYGTGLYTAFVGATEGDQKLALPYVRWTESQWFPGGRQRTYIAIQNVGSNLAAGAVTARYLDKDGNQVGVHSLPAIAAGAKVNTWAGHADVTGNTAALAEFGYAGGQFGGSVIVEGPAGSQLVAVARVASAASVGQVGEDYNGAEVAP
ncbi:MAG: hypothetical protein RRC07_17725, partial [Anaerolineae bacterium]|nr:hypothetical protein [Anaerolineae bacterium]